MRFPFVSRAVYDDLRADHAALLEKYHALKLQGAVVREKPPAVVQPPVDPAERVMREAKRQYIDRLAADYVQQGKSAHEAREIAQVIADGLDDLSPVEFS